MSMSYKELYNISHGIFLTFSSSLKKRTLRVNHSEDKRAKVKHLMPSMFESWTRENFIVANLFVNFKYSPSSFQAALTLLSDERCTKEEIIKFKNDIVNYRKFLKDDLIHLQKLEQLNVPIMVQEFNNHNIKWFTLYFFLLFSGCDFEDLKKSRINNRLIKKLETMLLFVSFSKETVLELQQQFKIILEKQQSQIQI